MGHALMENRTGLIVQAELARACGHAERRAALDMIRRHAPGPTRRPTLGADKGYDSAGFVAEPRKARVTPHAAQKARRTAIGGRTARHAGYALSQQRRKKIEEPFGWAKTIGGIAQAVHRGLDRVCARFTLAMAACHLARLPRLLATRAKAEAVPRLVVQPGPSAEAQEPKPFRTSAYFSDLLGPAAEAARPVRPPRPPRRARPDAPVPGRNAGGPGAAHDGFRRCSARYQMAAR
jgi:hypothetical protein